MTRTTKSSASATATKTRCGWDNLTNLRSAPDLQPREHKAGVVLEDGLAVLGCQEVHRLDDRLEVVEPAAGFRVDGRPAAGLLGAEQAPVRPDGLEQQLKRERPVQHGVEVQLPQLDLEPGAVRVTAQARREHLRLPPADLVGHRAAAVRDDDPQPGELLEDLAAQQRQDRDRLLGDEVLAVALAAVEAARGVDERGDVEVDHRLPQRVPVLVVQAGAVPDALVRVGVQADADEPEIVDGAIELGQRLGDRASGAHRQARDAGEAARMHRDGARDEVVVRLDPPVHDLLGLGRVHLVERARAQQLDVGAYAVHDLDVVGGRCRERVVADAGTALVVAPRGEQVRPVTVEGRGSNQVGMAIDDHGHLPLWWRRQLLLNIAHKLPAQEEYAPRYLARYASILAWSSSRPRPGPAGTATSPATAAGYPPVKISRSGLSMYMYSSAISVGAAAATCRAASCDRPPEKPVCGASARLA